MEDCGRGREELALLKVGVQTLHNELEAQALRLAAEDPTSGMAADIDGLLDVQACACTQLICQSMTNQTYHSLSGLVHCLPYHMNCAADYQQFFHAVKHINVELSSWMKLLEQMHGHATSLSTEELIEAILSTTRGFLKLQDKISVLASSAIDIVPLRYRKEKTARPLRVRALASYTGVDGFVVKEKAEYVLIDNSDPMVWKVEDSSGMQGQVPPVLMALSPPCPEAVESAHRLRCQMLSLWVSALRIFRGPSIRLTRDYVTSPATSQQCAELDSDLRNDVLLQLRALTRSLLAAHAGGAAAVASPPSSMGVLVDSNHPDSQRLTDAVTAFYETILRLPPKMDGSAQGPQADDSICEALAPWHQLRQLSRRLEDLKDYAVYYGAGDCHGASNGSLWISEARTYVSSAFIKRVKAAAVDVAASELPVGQTSLAYICEKRSSAVQEPLRQHIRSDNAEPVSRQDITRNNSGSQQEQEEVAKSAVGAGSSNWLKRRGLLIRQKSSLDDHQPQEPLSSQQQQQQGEPPTSKELQLPESDPVFVVLEVMNTRLGKYVSPSLALRHGLVDVDRHAFVDAASGARVPFEEAIAKGFVRVELMDELTNGYHDGHSLVMDAAASEPATHLLSVCSVEDPRTAARVSVQYAIAAGIVDATANVFCNPETKSKVTLEEALRNGKIEAAPHCPASAIPLPVASSEQSQAISDRSAPSARQRPAANLLKVVSTRRKSSKFVFAGVDMHDPNNVAYKALSEHMDVGVRGVVDPAGRSLSVREAYSQKLLKFDTLTFESAGAQLPVEEAAAGGLIKMAAAQALLGACRKLSLGSLVDSGALDLETGSLSFDSDGRQSLDSAIDSGALEPYAIFCRDGDGRLTSLGHVLKQGKREDTKGVAGALALLSDGAVKPHVGGLSKALREAFVLEQLSMLIDFKNVILLSEEAASLPFDEAVRAGVFNLERACVMQPEAGRSFELHDAVKSGFLKASAAKDIYRALDALSLQKALANNSMASASQPDGATDEAPEGGCALTSAATMAAALAQGLLSPESIYLVETFTKPGCPRVCSLACLQDEAVFSLPQCSFLVSGETVSLARAIDAALVRPAVKYWDFLPNEAVTLSELLPSKCVTERSQLAVSDDLSISVRDALASKVLNYSTPVHYDQSSGVVSLIEPDQSLVVPLACAPAVLDWLSDVEQQLAEQRQPCETCDGLNGQIQLLEVIQSELEHKRPEVTKLVDASCQVLEERKASEKSEFVQQQHQQLRGVSADMKSTHEKISRQLRNQLKQLRSMKGFLDDFHDKRSSFDEWADEAQRKLERAESGPLDLSAVEDLANQQKQVQEEVTQMETKLMGMQTTGLKFAAEANEYEKLVDAFRQTVHKPLRRSSGPTTAAASLPHVVQAATDAAAEKLRVVRSRSLASREKVHQLGQKAKRYHEQERAFLAWLPAAETRAVELCKEYIAASAEAGPAGIEGVRSALTVVSDLAAEAAAQRPACAALRSAADDLVGCLSALPAAAAAAVGTVTESVHASEARYNVLVDQLLAQQRHLEGILLDAQDVDRAVDTVVSAVDGVVQRLDAASAEGLSMSLDQSILASQLAVLHDLDAAAESAASQADQLEARLVEGQIDDRRLRLQDARKRITAARALGTVRAGELQALASRLSSLAGACDGLQRWVVDVVADLQLAASAADPAAVRLHCEEQYTAKHDRQPELDAIKADVETLIGDPRMTHQHCLLDLQADLCGKWRDLADLLIDLNVMQLLKDIEEEMTYFVKFEVALTKFIQFPADASKLLAQYREHQALHATLESKKDATLELIQRCTQMLRETSREDDYSTSLRLTDSRSFITNVWKLSAERQRMYEELLPLVQHFADTRANLRSWLNELMSELSVASMPCSSIDDIKKQQETIKLSAHSIEDQKPLVEDLANTAKEVAVLVGAAAEAAIVLTSAAAEVAAQFEAAHLAAHSRLADLAELLRSATTEVTDAIDGMLDELVQVQIRVENADGIAVTVDKIREQIEENKGLAEDADRRQLAIAGIKLSADKLLAQVREQEEHDMFDEDKPVVDAEDIEFKINEMESLNEAIKQKTELRGRCLIDTLSAAGEFWSIYNDLMRTFRDIQDSMRAQDPPQSDVSLIQEQEKEQKEIKEALRTAIPKLEVIRKMSENLVPLVGESGRVEIHRSIEEADDTFEDIGDRMNERQANLREAMENASHLEEEIEGILAWLPKFEEKMEKMSTGSLDMRSLRIQIEEVKILKLQMSSKCISVEAVRNQVAALRSTSAGGAEESCQSAVADIVARWNTLKMLIAVKEQELHDNLIQLGEVDVALEDMNGYLQQVEDDLRQIGNVTGDPKYIETHLKKIKMFEDDLLCQEPAVSMLNQTLAQMTNKNQTETLRASPLLLKQKEMNTLFSSVSTLIRDNRNKLNDNLTTVKLHLGEVDDLVNWFVEFEEMLKAVKTIGALPETAQKQCEKFNDHLTMLNNKSDSAHRLLVAGDEMMTKFSCHPFHTVQLRSSLSRLKRSCESAKKQAKKKKQKLQEHLQNVTGFHSVMKVFADWLASCEQSLTKFKNPSKIVETIEQQVKAHRDFQDDVEAHREIVERLDRTGTYLKYYGAKNDAVVIRNQLIAIKLRWKRLLWKTDERGRLLQRCRREDTRFADDWKALVQWLAQTKEDVDRAVEHNPSSARTRDLIEEIKRMELQMTRKYPRYFSTIRLGRSLKDRCTKGDPEREILSRMVDELKSKWAILRTELSHRQTQLDEKLLESGRLQEAAKSLTEWLTKAEDLLSEDSALLGDLDTVTMLLEQHKAFQDEIQNRGAVLNTLQQACSPQEAAAVAQLQQLLTRFERVQALTNVRSSKLQDSLALATEFQSAVNQLRDFLPQAETELKHQPLPESVAAIVALVEAHDRFEEQLEQVVPVVDRIKIVGEEIASHCHPNAVRFVKYYLTITSTRWEQLLERSRARRTKLQEALATIEGNMALLEELIAWLSDAEVLLFTKEEDDIPEDLALVEDLLKQHIDFHDELTEKGKEVEKFTALQLEQARPQTPRGKSGSSTQAVDSGNPSLAKLTSKWRSVWKMSLDRKKRLQEENEHLIEMESVRTFDFSIWRKRYLDWVKVKKLRITDFFRQQERNEDGTLSKDEFVTGMLNSKFPTNKAELGAVFAHFDRERTGKINYKEFIDALRPAGKKPTQPLTESEKIHDEIEREVAQCKCRVQLKCEKVDEGKYRFGEAQKLVLVRFLNSTVMVRVGGGWVTLEKFLESHDPCKAKGRTNTELRDQLAATSEANQTRATFTRRTAQTPTRGLSGASSPAPAHDTAGGTVSRHRALSGSTDCLSPEPSAAGVAAGAATPGRRSLSSLHRSKVLPAAQSMVNLAFEPSSPAQDYYSRYGSGGTLPRSGAKTPTQLLQQRPSSTTPSSSKGRKPGTPTLRGVSQTPPPMGS